jgi:hypothetical protein
VKPRIIRDNLRIATIKVGRSHTWTAEVIGEPVTTKTWRSEKETSHIENHERITITNEDYSTTFSIKDAMRKVVVNAFSLNLKKPFRGQTTFFFVIAHKWGN